MRVARCQEQPDGGGYEQAGCEGGGEHVGELPLLDQMTSSASTVMPNCLPHANMDRWRGPGILSISFQYWTVVGATRSPRCSESFRAMPVTPPNRSIIMTALILGTLYEVLVGNATNFLGGCFENFVGPYYMADLNASERLVGLCDRLHISQIEIARALGQQGTSVSYYFPGEGDRHFWWENCAQNHC